MNRNQRDRLHCPSAQPSQAGSQVFGIVGGTAQQPQMKPLKQSQPVTEELLNLASPVAPTEVFRFHAPCAESECAHFDGAHCQLVQRIVNLLPTVSEVAPPCPIRGQCRWWQQEGMAACQRCPQVVTQSYGGSEAQRLAAGQFYP